MHLGAEEEAGVRIELRIPDPPARLVLSSFVQPDVLRAGELRASRSGRALEVRAFRDERNFAAWEIRTATEAGPVTVAYRVAPGAAEEIRMAGPTGYRFGHAGADYALVTGRQLFVFPVEPPPGRFRVRFALPSGWEVEAPWEPAGLPGEFSVQGEHTTVQLLDAVVGAGRLDSREAAGGRIRILASDALPGGPRRIALERAAELAADLAASLGPPRDPFLLFFVPPHGTGDLVSVAPGPRGMGLSIGSGVPTRWLGIGRQIGRACLGESRDRGRAEAAWIRDALPTYLTVLHSARKGWRSRQEWMEHFFYETAGREMDLTAAPARPDPLPREWRGAILLDRLSRELESRGLASIEERCRIRAAKADGPGRDLLPAEDLPEEMRSRLRRWLAAEDPLPFPGRPADAAPERLTVPPPIPARAGRRLDLYVGGRNFGLLEQCGCRSEQMGGMARRAQLLRPRLGRRGAVAVELGDSVPFDRIAPLPPERRDAESDLALSLLSAAGAAANVVGFAELGYGAGYLRDRAERLPPGFRLLAANLVQPPLRIHPALELPGTDSPVLLAGLVDPAAYHLGRPVEFEDAIAGIPLEDPVEALRRLRERRPDATLLAAGPISPSTFLRIRSGIPGLPLVVTDDYFRFDRDPRFRFDRDRGGGFANLGMLEGTLVAVLRSDSYALVRLGVALGPDGGILGAELEDLPLDESVGEDPGVRARLDAYYAGRESGTGEARGVPIGKRLRDRLDAEYVGGRVCEACHAEQAAQWRNTRHAAAFATLLERRRQAAPGCVPCHVTGHSLPGGYARIGDIRLRHVQCEACHGPGARHAAAPSRASIVRTPAAADCRECHDPEHSEMTDANFGRYWETVVHHAGGGEGLSGDRR